MAIPLGATVHSQRGFYRFIRQSLSFEWLGRDGARSSGLRNLISANRPTQDLVAGVLSGPKSLGSSDA